MRMHDLKRMVGITLMIKLVPISLRLLQHKCEFAPVGPRLQYLVHLPRLAAGDEEIAPNCADRRVP